MNFILDKISKNRSISNLQKYDIIKLSTNDNQIDCYMVYEIEKDMNIPAVLLQLWKFEGGYDHMFINTLENDLNINTHVPVMIPLKIYGKIKKITSYRPEKSGLTEKEEFFFDVWPKSESPKIDNVHTLPYKCKITYQDQIKELILPSWTPLQKLPLDKIKIGSVLEIWETDNISTIVKVQKL